MEVMALLLLPLLLLPMLTLMLCLELDDLQVALALSASESESSDRAMEEEAEIHAIDWFIVVKARQGNPQSSPATGYISVTVT